jgi:SAM-dependent methyltransferase
MAADSEHWNAHAARWSLIGEPLRPGPTDLAAIARSVQQHLGDEPPQAALLLGVTPEIAQMSWPTSMQLVAVDQSEGMVRAVWPGDTAQRRASVGDWLTFQAETPFDLVLGDGVFSLFEYPAGYARLASALARLTRPGGLLNLRLFCRPEPHESLEQVFAALACGTIGNFHIFKWRLAMAVQGDATRGARLGDIWQAFRDGAGSVASLAAQSGWPEPVVGTIDGYRDVNDRYSYSTEREVIELLASDFELVETWRPTYELGERCPHLSFRRRA